MANAQEELSREEFFGDEEQKCKQERREKCVQEAVDDSDWIGQQTEARQSVSCGAIIMLNGNLIHFQSKRQKSAALSSSCEAEKQFKTVNRKRRTTPRC